MMEVRFLPEALDGLAKLNAATLRRIVRRIAWLAANFKNIQPERLSGQLSHLFKFRVGDYRVLYQALSDEQALLIYKIGHRREIYQ